MSDHHLGTDASDAHDAEHHEHRTARIAATALLAAGAALGGIAAAPTTAPPMVATSPAAVQQIDQRTLESMKETDAELRALEAYTAYLHADSAATKAQLDASAQQVADVVRAVVSAPGTASDETPDVDEGAAAFTGIALYVLAGFVAGFREAARGDAEAAGAQAYRCAAGAARELALHRSRLGRWRQSLQRRRSPESLATDRRAEVRSATLEAIAHAADTSMELHEAAIRNAADQAESALRDALVESGLCDPAGARRVAASARAATLRLQAEKLLRLAAAPPPPTLPSSAFGLR